MKKELIDESARVVRSHLGRDVEVREYATIRDSHIGAHSRVYEHASIKKSTIGSRASVNAGTYVEFADIADDVMIGPNCSIVGVSHDYDEKGPKKENAFTRIYIEKGVFIGAGSIVLPGRKIGEGSVIGAGSIVTEDIPAYARVIGTPPTQTIVPLARKDAPAA